MNNHGTAQGSRKEEQSKATANRRKKKIRAEID
jgi:hypothetical protein